VGGWPRLLISLPQPMPRVPRPSRSLRRAGVGNIQTKIWGQTGRTPFFLGHSAERKTGERPVCPHVSSPSVNCSYESDASALSRSSHTFLGMVRKILTMAGSNCLPDQPSISFRAASIDWEGR
jgi:hypothetical protein